MTLQHIAVNATLDGANVLVTGVANKHIVVVSYCLSGSITGTATIEDETGNDSAVFQTSTGSIHIFDGSRENPAFRTQTAGENLESTNSAGVDLVGHLTYYLED